MFISRRRTIVIICCLIIFFIVLYSIKNQNDISLRKRDPYITLTFLNEDPSMKNAIQLVDPSYILEPFVHKECSGLLGILIITSYVGHDALRSAHRQAMPSNVLRSMGFQRVFLLAQIPSLVKYITQKAIIDENNRFEDLLQGDFIEAYRNLSYKHLMGLKWSSVECQNAQFIIKADDDTIFDIYHLKYYLENIHITRETSYLAGFILDEKRPIRVKANKWYVSEQEYSRSIYPDYLSGWLYITNPFTAQQLVRQAKFESFFWIDDTWMTGIVRSKLSIPLTRLNDWYSSNPQFLDCCIEDVRRLRLKCDYYVGPNGGDDKMIAKYTQEIGKCYQNAGYCFRRPLDKLLNRTCIGQVKNIIGQHGDAIVSAIKL